MTTELPNFPQPRNDDGGGVGCKVCHGFGWRWTSKISEGDCRGQWSGWYLYAWKPKTDDPAFKYYDIRRGCHLCGGKGVGDAR